VVLALTCCVATYPEPHFSSQTAKILGDKNFKTEDFQGILLAGKVDKLPVSYPPFKGVYVVVPAGDHEIGVDFQGWIRKKGWLTPVGPNMATAILTAQLKPGGVYQVRANTSFQEIWFRIEDTRTGQPVSPEVKGNCRHFEPVTIYY
jgi:hypothetical protein